MNHAKNRGNAGKGRRKGSENKITRTAREMFTLAAQGLGGLTALQSWAIDNPTEFWKLYARLIPQEHTGEDGKALIPPTIRHIYETVNPPKP